MITNFRKSSDDEAKRNHAKKVGTETEKIERSDPQERG